MLLKVFSKHFAILSPEYSKAQKSVAPSYTEKLLSHTEMYIKSKKRIDKPPLW